jgi:hypothetical protein
MTIRLYLDEDTSDTNLMAALHLRGVDAAAAVASGMGGKSDERQLIWASEQRRVLYSFNCRDFYKIHSELLRKGQSHRGIILGVQQRYSVGEQMRRLLRLIHACSAEEMQDRVEFQSAWS